MEVAHIFLNGELDPDKEVYMEQPQGYEESDRKQYVYKLLKSLYGLKQAGRKWYDALCRVHKNGNITILACHIDDCMITRNSQESIQNYKDKLKEKYSLTDLGPANWLLGIKITRDLEAQAISLSQSTYINSILTHFNFTDLKPSLTPMNPSIQFSKDQCPQTLKETIKMSKILY